LEVEEGRLQEAESTVLHLKEEDIEQEMGAAKYSRTDAALKLAKQMMGSVHSYGLRHFEGTPPPFTATM
jgi:hypothetical protein